jgi:hypothetical protein
MTEKNWGGSRPNAGRPRTETLSAADCRFLVELVEQSAYATEYAELVATLRRMAARAEGITPRS